MDKDSGEIFTKLKKDLSAYIELKLELLKLNTYERTGKVITLLSYGIILLLLAFFAILFIFLALGFYLGAVFNSLGIGFGVVALLYLIMIYLAVANQNRIKEKIMNLIISALMSNEENNNIKDGNYDTTTDATATGTASAADSNATIEG